MEREGGCAEGRGRKRRGLVRRGEGGKGGGLVRRGEGGGSDVGRGKGTSEERRERLERR